MTSRYWIDQLTDLDSKVLTSTEDGKKLVSDHAHLKQQMSDAHVFVCEEGQNLLSALQKPCDDERSAKARSRVSDFSEAVSHVMDVILGFHEQNRQLTKLWDKQRVHLGQKLKLLQFQNESNEVSTFYQVI